MAPLCSKNHAKRTDIVENGETDGEMEGTISASLASVVDTEPEDAVDSKLDLMDEGVSSDSIAMSAAAKYDLAKCNSLYSTCKWTVR